MSWLSSLGRTIKKNVSINNLQKVAGGAVGSVPIFGGAAKALISDKSQGGIWSDKQARTMPIDVPTFVGGAPYVDRATTPVYAANGATVQGSSSLFPVQQPGVSTKGVIEFLKTPTGMIAGAALALGALSLLRKN